MSYPLQIDPIATFETNYVWAINDGRHCVLVDPGSAAEPLRYLAEHQLTLTALLLTHHHHDHIGGVDEILARHPVPVYGPGDSRMPAVTHVVHEGDQVKLDTPKLQLDVLETPGHTTSHIVFHNQDILLAGDTLFSVGCGRLFEGTAEQMQGSMDKLAALPDHTLLYCAHEYTQSNIAFARQVEPDNEALKRRAQQVDQLREAGEITLPVALSEERATNPFLRTREPSVIRAARHREPGTASTPAAVFGVIRRWKDG